MEEGMRHEVFRDLINERIQGRINGIAAVAANHVSDVEDNLNHPERFGAMVEEILRDNPTINSCGISFIENYFPQKGRCFCPYAVRTDSTTIQVMPDGIPGRNYLDEEWFVNGIKGDSCFWSDPFYVHNDSGNILLLAYMSPVCDPQGRVVAILGIDIPLQWLTEEKDKMMDDIIAQELYYGSSSEEEDQEEKNRHHLRFPKPYSFIVGKDGDYLSHPDTLRINTSYFTCQQGDTAAISIGRKMVSGAKGYYAVDGDDYSECSIDSTTSYVFYAPIEGTDWSLALVVPSNGIHFVGTTIGIVMLVIIAIGLLLTFLVGYFTIRSATMPLRSLAATADEVAKGNFNIPLKPVKQNNEIRQLRDSFVDMQHSLTNYVQELKATTASNAAIEKELSIAHKIQMSMVPKTFPPFPSRGDIDIYGIINPAKAVGGDLFDFNLRDEKLFFCIGDVSGKGVPASLVMAVMQSLFRNISSHVDNPVDIVKSLNVAIAEGNTMNMFVTFFVGILDLRTGELQYCNAGHDAPLLITADGCEFLSCDANIPVAVLKDWDFTLQRTVLSPKTSLLLYTDGLTEAEDSTHQLFGTDRILQEARQSIAQGTLQSVALVKQIEKAVDNFIGDAEQSDDLTMLAIRYMP